MTPSLPAAYAELSTSDREKLDLLVSTLYQLQTTMKILTESLARTPDLVFAVSMVEMFLLSGLYERLDGKFGVTRH